MIKNITKLQNTIGIKFRNIKLLEKSLIHKSFDSIHNNEKLEFLGDRVLGLIISKKLLEIYPDEKEGILDKKLASLVNKKKCLEISKTINLDQHITIRMDKKKIKIEDKIVADCLEALIGAIYLDTGFNSVEKCILKLWSENIKASNITLIDAKTKLQEYSLKKYKKLPTYKLIESTGPKHQPIFKIAVRLFNSKFINADGSSKKEAEQNAAKLFLKSLEK